MNRPRSITFLSILTILFGIMTLKEGGQVIFTDAGKINAGHYVPFVLYFNFLAGFAYITAGVMLWRMNAYVRHLASTIALATCLVLILFSLHMLNGGAYELRTVFALTLRSTLWIAVALVTLRSPRLNSPLN